MYVPTEGKITITSANHGLREDSMVKFADDSVTFTCDHDSNATNHSYPRAERKKFTVTDASYNTATGVVTFTLTGHGIKKGEYIKVKDNALSFSCTHGDQSTKTYPRSTDPQIKIYMPRGSWGLIDKDLNYFSEKQLELDYLTWKREFLEYDNMVDFRDIAKHQKEFMFYCSDFNLQNLIDIKPNPGSSYIRSLTEPFDVEMELKEEQIKNWFERFGVISKERDWHQEHVSGHGDSEQLMRVIDGANAKKLIPIHTTHDEYHKRMHPNVHTVKQHDTYDLG